MSHYRLEFQANNSNYALPIVYVDSDWGEDCMDRKSISGFAVLLDGGAILWGSKKQTSVSLSTVPLRQNSLLRQQLLRKFFGIDLYLAHLT